VETSPFDVDALHCPSVNNTGRHIINNRNAVLLTSPSLSHAPLDDILQQCGHVYRSKLMTYAAFHNEAIELLRTAGLSSPHPPSVQLPKIVVWRCKTDDPIRGCGGFADRIVGIESAFAFAMRYTRVFLLDWPGMSEVLPAPLLCNYQFHKSLVAGRNKRTYDLFNCDTILNEQGCIWNREDPSTDFNDDVVIFMTNRGAYGAMQHLPQLDALGLTPSIAPACLMHSICTPVPSLVEEVHAFRDMLAAHNVIVVGVHFRMGDVSLVAGDDNTDLRDQYRNHYINCLHNYTSELRGNNVAFRMLIIGEDVQLRQQLHEEFSDVSLALTSTPVHLEAAIYASFNKEQPGDADDVLRSTVFEWLLYADADALLMSSGSGFSRTAWAYSGKPFAIQVVANYGALPPKATCIIQSLPQAATNPSVAGI
jgi:hypothetical protein